MKIECCHQLYTVVLSFLPYTTGKQQLDLKMPKTRHVRSINRSQRDNRSAIADFKRLGTIYRVFFSAPENGPWGRVSGPLLGLKIKDKACLF